MKRLLLCMTLVTVLACAGISQAATNHWKLDIQNMDADWSSGAAIDMVEEGVTWNIMRLPTITGVPSPTFTTDPWISLIQTDGSGGEVGDPNIVFQITGDVVAGKFSAGSSTTMIPVRTDYIFIGSAGFVDPTVLVYDWSVTNLAADTRYILTFYSMSTGGRGGKFTANGGEIELDQAAGDTAILIIDSDSNGDITGTAEGFTAEFNWAGLEIQLAQDPLITSQPASVNASVGDTVEFGVAALNPAGGELEYQWFVDPNTSIEGNETALEDGENVSGATSDTLTISDIEEADFAWYYCEVSNSSGTVASDAAAIILKEQVYHWKLDGDGVEANGTGYDGTLEEGSEFTEEGKVDGALSTDGVDGQMRIPAVTMTTTGSISISFWVNPVDVTGNWKGMMAKWDDAGHTFWIGQHSGDGQINFSVYPSGEMRVVSGPVLTNGEWTHIVCTHDGSAIRIYADGMINATANINNEWFEGNGDLLLGTVPAGGNWFNGLIDDVQVFNYAMDGEDVADLYYQVTGEASCTDPVEMDFNDDCIVNVEDLAIFASKWMLSNIYPN